MAMYVRSDEMRRQAEQLQTKYPHFFSDLNLEKIVFLKELESPSKNKLAVTKRFDAATKAVYGDLDYMIIFFEKRMEELVPAQKNICMMRELRKCQWDGEKIRKYDVEDFYEIAASFGVDWQYNDRVRDPLADNVELVERPEVEEADSTESEVEEDTDE